MPVKTATGKACCTKCGELIPAGVLCFHLDVNSRAAPYICKDCLEEMYKLVSGDWVATAYEIKPADPRSQNIYSTSRDSGPPPDLFESDDNWGTFPVQSTNEDKISWVDHANAKEAIVRLLSDHRVVRYKARRVSRVCVRLAVISESPFSDVEE